MAWYQQDLTNLAFFWRLTRRDGVRLAFTSHDRDLWVEGQLYRTAPGMVPSAVETSDGLENTGVEIAGAITDRLMTEADLRSGRWDGADLLLVARDWTDLAAAPVFLARGILGAVRIEDGRFGVDLVGPEVFLDQAAGIETSPMCRAELGDCDCRVPMAGRRHLARVQTAAGATVMVTGSFDDGQFAQGRARWLTGGNAGTDSWIEGSIGGTLTLRSAPAFAVQTADLVDVIEGCDLRFETCVSRFDNGANFRGEPHLPGNDLLTRYAS